MTKQRASSVAVAGFLTEGFDIPPAIMMSYNQPYYPVLAERADFTKAKDLLGFYKDASTVVPPRLLALAEGMQRKSHVVIRPVNLRVLVNDMLIVRALYNAGWRSNWGFAPISAEEMYLVGRELKPIVRPELALLAFARDRPIGVMIEDNELINRFDTAIGARIYKRYRIYEMAL